MKPTDGIRRCGLVARVSTNLPTQEGSLKVQVQRLKDHLAAKGDGWVEVENYVLEGVSGKDSVRSPEFERLYSDIRGGRLNTVMCTALDRISRSIRDFLQFFEFLQEHGVEFVCLRQNYDTTTPQGRFFVNVLMALAQFEREQVGQRVSEHIQARAANGEWTGGRLLGYDTRKNTLVPNEHADLVRRVFDTYLEEGSFRKTATRLNEEGVLVPAYRSARGRYHAENRWAVPSVGKIIANHVYVGEREVNKTHVYQKGPNGKKIFTVQGNWPAIISRETWDHAQRIRRGNRVSRRNRPFQSRNYLLNGLLTCGYCRGRIGCSSTLKHRSTTEHYRYYRCPNCGYLVNAENLHEIVEQRIAQIAGDRRIIDEITGRLIEESEAALPALRRRLSRMGKDLQTIEGESEEIIKRMVRLPEESGKLLELQLNKLGSRRKLILEEIRGVELDIQRAEQSGGSSRAMSKMFRGLNDELQLEQLGTEKKAEIIRLIVKSAELTRDALQITWHGGRTVESTQHSADAYTPHVIDSLSIPLAKSS